MAGGRYDQRVRDLLADAEEAAARFDWAAVRDLAGAALALSPGSETAEALLAEAERAAPTAGERRQLTVLFSDVVGSTALSQSHDPELVREVLRSYQETCDHAVRRYEGRIARFIGDGVLAYFGHPVPHEDDALRAVKAGLDLLAGLRPVVEEIRARYRLDLSVRVAVHTGMVVLADMGSAATPDREAIVGETPNVAARLQDHAAPGSLLISAATHELVRGRFLVLPSGPLTLRGIREPVDAYQVLEEVPADDRVRVQADLSPFVGRDEQLEILATAWSEVAAGGFNAVVVSGQPGVGKSRLVDVIRRRSEEEGATALVTGCSTYHQATAFHPVRRLIERAADIQPNQDPQLALARLWRSMERAGQTHAMPCVADLLELPPTDWCPAPQLDPPRLREELLTALVQWVRARAAAGPIVVVVDDVQWADPTTMELLGRIVRDQPPHVMLAVTVRDDVKVPWPSALKLELDGLGAQELDELVRRLPDGRMIAEEDVATLVERSDGIPLFVEELVRAHAQASAGGAGDGTIPAALRDLLLARFAAPGVDLRTAQRIATIGAEVALPLIAAVCDGPDAQLDQQLAALVDAGVLVLRPGDPPTYRFRHHLLAEMAYDTQLLPARREAHRAVAELLLGDLPVGALGGPAVLAHHLELAGERGDAIRALTGATEAAHRLGANEEVATLLERAFSLLDDIEGSERTELEMDLRLLRALNQSSILGFAAPQVAEDYQRCRELVADAVVDGYLDDPTTDAVVKDGLLWAGSGLWATFMLLGQLDDAVEINRSLTERLDPAGPTHAYFIEARSYIDFYRGDMDVAVAGMERAHAMWPEVDQTGRASAPGDMGVTGLAYLSYGLAIAGRLADARAASDEALAMARALPFPEGPFTVCWSACMRAGVEMAAGDPTAAREHAELAREVAERHGFTFWTIVTGFYDAALAMGEGDEDAVSRAQSAVFLLRSVGVLVWLPSMLSALSAVHLRRGEIGLAQAVLADAGAMAEQTGAHYWSAEITRQEGEALIAVGDREGGLHLLRTAVSLATQQHARLLELWARTSLCRHGADATERAGLAELVDLLSDGAGLEADLADARAVLAERA